MLKKKYVLNIGPEQRGAVVARDGRDTAVQVDDGELTPVNYRPVLNGKAISIRYGGRLHLVHVTGVNGNGQLQVTVNGRPVALTVMDELKAQALESLGGGAGSGTIAADIPGLVVEIKVALGDRVNLGDPVIVVEAMKMQNELTAAVSGTVREIPVGAGQSVNPGDVLVVIEPETAG
ncbi:biotin/lipoyl-binding protein [bacterium]|nr:biotin/lipoyl-binding protein [bacterium]